MTQEQQLKLQAFFDGELPEREARQVADWIATDPEAAALHNEFRNTRNALSGFESDLKLPESREFYWSKIEREILKGEHVEQIRPVASPAAWLWRLLVPAGALAALAIVGLVAIKNFGPAGTSPRPEMVIAMTDPGALVYRDEREGMTLVWLSYGENRLANGDAAATIQ